MKIAFLAPAHKAHTHRWARWLADHGQEVVLLSDTHPRVDQDYRGIRILHPDWTIWNKILVFKIKGGPLANNREKWRVHLPLVESEKPDVVHAHEALSYGPTLAALDRWPRVLTPWGVDMEYLKSGGEEAELVKLAVRSADVVSTNAPGMEQEWAALGGVNPARFRLFSWGIDTSLFRPGTSAEVDAIRSRIGLQPGEPYILSPRLARPHYRIEALIHAHREASVDARLVVLRAGTDESSWAALGALRHDRVLLVDALMTAQEMAALYTGATAVVMIPRTDILAMSLLEALACGAPVIAPPLPGYASSVGDLDDNAPDRLPVLLTPEPVESSLAAAIRRAVALTLPERARIAARAGACIGKHHDWGTNAARMLDVYQEAVERFGSRT